MGSSITFVYDSFISEHNEFKQYFKEDHTLTNKGVKEFEKAEMSTYANLFTSFWKHLTTEEGLEKIKQYITTHTKASDGTEITDKDRTTVSALLKFVKGEPPSKGVTPSQIYIAQTGVLRTDLLERTENAKMKEDWNSVVQASFPNYELLENEHEAEMEMEQFFIHNFQKEENASWRRFIKKDTISGRIDRVVLANVGTSSTQIGCYNGGNMKTACNSELGRARSGEYKVEKFRIMFEHALNELKAKTESKTLPSTLLLFNAIGFSMTDTIRLKFTGWQELAILVKKGEPVRVTKYLNLLVPMVADAKRKLRDRKKNGENLKEKVQVEHELRPLIGFLEAADKVGFTNVVFDRKNKGGLELGKSFPGGKWIPEYLKKLTTGKMTETTMQRLQRLEDTNTKRGWKRKVRGD